MPDHKELAPRRMQAALATPAARFPLASAAFWARARNRSSRSLQGGRCLCLLRGKGKDRHGAGLMPFA